MQVDYEHIDLVKRCIRSYIDIQKHNNHSFELSDDNILTIIKKIVESYGNLITLSEEEYELLRKDISCEYQVFCIPGQSIVDDYNEEKWYDKIKDGIQPNFWRRYKDYLIDIKHFNPNVISTLGDDTLDNQLMNYLGNPDSNKPYLKRGLIIGDVQSGKTSTYIGLMCKAADAGYKVFILLSGVTEPLRKQTQERVEEGFIGINMSAAEGIRVGVGKDQKPIMASAMTSRKSDFTKDIDKIAVSLNDKNAIVFVIKKNAKVLRKLTDWLVRLNTDPKTQKIDLPMLLIDDEADNASINTSQEKESPTVINKMIRDLANVFTKSNYVGFTATPFANVFIDPETTEKMTNQDLFPEDFIVVLPRPSNYISPVDIFSEKGKYHGQLNYIKDAGVEEADGWPFYYKHKKDWTGKLPDSLRDALYTFYLANAIRDLRGHFKEHRSMLINISRFIKVQRYVKEQVEILHREAYTAIKFYLSSENFNENMNNPILRRIYDNWKKFYSKLEFSWEEVAGKIFSSIENIKIKVVNSSRTSEKLEYGYNESVRVVAIGGLALSRGLTLEGLITSYFYRNTCTYDVLMQMGRWFGYRKGYEDLFRIWLHKESAEWYAEIAESTEMLKNDMSLMREREQKPKDFGIRVRKNSPDLQITAANKMRNAVDEYEYTSYYGGVVDTPYLIYDPEVQKSNFHLTESFVNDLVSNSYSLNETTLKGIGTHNVIYKVPKVFISDFLRKIRISKFSDKFDTSQIVNFIDESADPALDFWNIAFMDGIKSESDAVAIGGKIVYKIKRNKCKFDKVAQRLSLSRQGKLIGTADGMLGIEDFGEESSAKIIENIKTAYAEDYRKENLGTEPSSYTSSMWFKYTKNRRPTFYMYFVDVNTDDDNQKRQANEFRKEMGGLPVVGFAMGVPASENKEQIEKNKFKANKLYNWFELNESLNECEEEE